jgi:hypothetical protein
MDMDGFGSRVLKIYREPVMFTGFKLFYKMTIGIIQKCTLLKVAIHTKTKLHSISIIYRLMKIISPVCSSEFCYGRLLPIQIKRNSRNRPAANTLENKVVNKVITKVTNDAPPFFQKKEVPILCYHNIKDFDAVLAQ